MTKEIFVALIENIKNHYEEQYEFTRKLEKLFGQDSSVFLEVCTNNIDLQLAILSKAIGDKADNVDWLFWESLNTQDESGIMTFTVNGKEFPGTPGNIWELVQGNLD